MCFRVRVSHEMPQLFIRIGAMTVEPPARAPMRMSSCGTWWLIITPPAIQAQTGSIGVER